MGIGNFEHRRLLVVVYFKSIFVAAGKGIARGRINERGGHTRNGFKLALTLVERRQGLKQRPGIGMAGV